MRATRFDIDAVDGMPLAVWEHGDGPAIVMVHGSIADHTTFDPFVAVLGEQMTTYSVDRRGSAPPVTRRSIRSSASSRTLPPSSTRSPHAPADMSPCGVTPTAPTARWAAPRAATTSGNWCCTNRASGSRTRRDRSPHRGGPRRGDNDAAIVAVLVDILEDDRGRDRRVPAKSLWPVRLAAAPTIPRSATPKRTGLPSRASSTRSPRRR